MTYPIGNVGCTARSPPFHFRSPGRLRFCETNSKVSTNLAPQGVFNSRHLGRGTAPPGQETNSPRNQVEYTSESDFFSLALAFIVRPCLHCP